MLTISKAVFLLGLALGSGSTEKSLLNAARNGRSEEVSTLISRGALVNQIVDVRGNTALLLAVLSTRIDVVRVLLRSGAEVNKANKEGVTPLIAAAGNGNVEIVSMLFEYGANVRIVNLKRESALHPAVRGVARHGHTDVVRILLARGAEVDQQDVYQQTPLIVAAAYGNAEVVSILIENNARLPLSDWSGQSALHTAVSHGHSEVVRILLASGAEVDQANRAGLTPLIAAAENGHTEVVSILIEYHANARLADLFDQRVADACFRSMVIFSKLVDAGLNINVVSVEGSTPLMMAVRSGNRERVSALIVSGAKVNQVTEKGTALTTAVGTHDKYMIKTLIIAGAEIPENVEEINRMMSAIRSIATSDPMSGILTSRQRVTAAFITLRNDDKKNFFDRAPFRALFTEWMWNEDRFRRVSRIVRFLVDLGCEAFAFHEIFSRYLSEKDLTSLNKLGVILSFLVSPLSPRTTIPQAADKTELMRFNKKIVFACHVKGPESTIDTMFAVYNKIRDHTRASQMAMDMLPGYVTRSVLQFGYGEFGTFSEFEKLLKQFTLTT